MGKVEAAQARAALRPDPSREYSSPTDEWTYEVLYLPPVPYGPRHAYGDRTARARRRQVWLEMLSVRTQPECTDLRATGGTVSCRTPYQRSSSSSPLRRSSHIGEGTADHVPDDFGLEKADLDSSPEPDWASGLWYHPPACYGSSHAAEIWPRRRGRGRPSPRRSSLGQR